MVRKEMSEIDEYLKDELKRTTSFTLTPMYKQCLRKLSVKFYGSDANYIATTLRRVIVMEGLSILNGEPIDSKLWEETEKVGNTEVMMLKINDKIEELLQKVVTVHLCPEPFCKVCSSKGFFINIFQRKTFGRRK